MQCYNAIWYAKNRNTKLWREYCRGTSQMITVVSNVHYWRRKVTKMCDFPSEFSRLLSFVSWTSLKSTKAKSNEEKALLSGVDVEVDGVDFCRCCTAWGFTLPIKVWICSVAKISSFNTSCFDIGNSLANFLKHLYSLPSQTHSAVVMTLSSCGQLLEVFLPLLGVFSIKAKFDSILLCFWLAKSLLPFFAILSAFSECGYFRRMSNEYITQRHKKSFSFCIRRKQSWSMSLPERKLKTIFHGHS